MRRWTVLLALPFFLGSGCVSWWEHRELGDLYRQQSVVLEDARAEAKNARASISVVEAELEGAKARNRLLAEEISSLQAALADARAEIGRKYEVAAAPLRDLSEFRTIEGVTVSDQGAIVLEDSIFFASGSHELKSTGQGSLRRVVELLAAQKYAGYDIQVSGHTDDDPIRRTANRYADNWDLGFNRSRAVALFMLGQGIRPERVVMASFGEYRPVSQKKAENRRVEIVLVRKESNTSERF